MKSSSQIIKCPRCGQNSVFGPENPHRPFCSQRCQLIDLGQWAAESYVIASEPKTDKDFELLQQALEDEDSTEPKSNSKNQ